MEAWADEEGEVQVIEDAFELHASMRARPEMNYYYYYYYSLAGAAAKQHFLSTSVQVAGCHKVHQQAQLHIAAASHADGPPHHAGLELLQCLLHSEVALHSRALQHVGGCVNG